MTTLTCSAPTQTTPQSPAWMRYEFDREYVNRLVQGDPEIESHFAHYFGDMLRIKLRFRLRSSTLVEDARQETFLRVLQALRNGNGIRSPERLGAFVNSVCEHVLCGFIRTSNRFQPGTEKLIDPEDKTLSPESNCITEERKILIRRALSKLSKTDQLIIQRVFLEERDKDKIRQELGLSPSNLRVRMHRALARFRTVLGRQPANIRSQLQSN